MGWGDHRRTNDLGAVRAAAVQLNALGYAVCALDPDEKKPTYKEWSIRPLSPEDFRPGEGIGIMAGPVSGRPGHELVFVDLDSPAAIRLADEYLPPTGMMEGRPAKPNSHRGYMVRLDTIPADKLSTAPMAARDAIDKYGHPGSKTEHYAKVLDLIGTGGQVAAPPTLHESGQVRQWAGGRPGEPAVAPYPDLHRAVRSLLTACGYMPKKTRPITPDLVAALDTDESLTPLVDAPLRHRIERYLEKIPPAVSGNGGSGRTFAVACALVWGFALDTETALEFLARHYNPRCSPPWTISELQHKVEDAMASTAHQKPRGHLLRPRTRTTFTTSTEWTTL